MEVGLAVEFAAVPTVGSLLGNVVGVLMAVQLGELPGKTLG